MADTGLQITATKVDDHDVLEVAGELDLISAPELQRAIDQMVHDGRGSLVLDLSGVRFLDSAGLRVLVRVHRALTEQRSELRIVCTTMRVREVFRVANLEQLFVVHDSVAAAIGG